MSADFFQRRYHAARVVRRAPWIDVLGEIGFGTKNQSNEVNTTSFTPRVGVQLHILEDSRWRGGAAVGSLSRGSVWISGRFCDSKMSGRNPARIPPSARRGRSAIDSTWRIR
jgi:hypothetical protein